MPDVTQPPPKPAEDPELQTAARAAADELLVNLVDRMPTPAAAIDVLCYCTAYLAWRVGLKQDEIVQRVREYMSEAEETARAGAVVLEARRKGRKG